MLILEILHGFEQTISISGIPDRDLFFLIQRERPTVTKHVGICLKELTKLLPRKHKGGLPAL